MLGVSTPPLKVELKKEETIPNNSTHPKQLYKISCMEKWEQKCSG